MKKCFTILLVVVMCLLCACQDSTPTEPTTGIIHQEPPRMVSFGSPEELAAMMDAVELTEAEFAAFLEQNHYYAYSVRQGEISRLKNLLQTVGYPIVADDDSFERFTMIYYPQVGYHTTYEIIYKINGIRYLFSYSEFEKRIDRSNWEFIMSSDIDGVTIPVYLGTDTRGMDYLSGELYANNYQIVVIVDNYTSIDDVSFEPFLWNCEMTSITPEDHVTE